MDHFEVVARMKIRPGELQGFKAQAAELMRLTRDRDTKTLRYDWFIDEDAMQCEVHEDYVDESGLIEHNEHIVDARAVLFEKYGYDHQMSVFGDISPQLRTLFEQHAGGVALHRFFQGLEQQAAV
jgi:quinol monooxygenase YgiN